MLFFLPIKSNDRSGDIGQLRNLKERVIFYFTRLNIISSCSTTAFSNTFQLIGMLFIAIKKYGQLLSMIIFNVILYVNTYKKTVR